MVKMTTVTLEITPNNTSRYPIGSGWNKTSANSYTFYPDLPFGSTNFGWQAGDSSHWDSTGNTTWSGNEWPASGAFDKRLADTYGNNAGWHINNSISYVPYNSNGSVYAYFYLNWPVKGYITSYSVQSRSGCCTDQPPSAWILYTGGTALHSVSGQRNWSLAETRTFVPTDTTTLCTGCSFNIFAANNASGGYTHVSELRVYITPDNDSSGYSNFYGTSVSTFCGWANRQLGGSGNSMSNFRGKAGISSTATNISLCGTVLPAIWNS
jgi:hypothetical protein